MGNKLITEIGQSLLNTLAMPAEMVTGQNFYDPTFTSNVGKGLNATQDVIGGAGAAFAPAAAGMIGGPMASAAVQGLQSGMPNLGTQGTQLEGHSQWNGGFGTGQAAGAVAAPFLGGTPGADAIAREGGYMQQMLNGGYPMQYPEGGMPQGMPMQGQEQGMMERTGPNMDTFNGPSHEQGGMQIAPNVEIEKQETAMDTGKGKIIMSDKTINPATGETFAHDAKKWKGKDTDDPITKRTNEMALKKLENSQEELRRIKLEKKQLKLNKELAAAGLPIPGQEQQQPQGPMQGGAPMQGMPQQPMPQGPPQGGMPPMPMQGGGYAMLDAQDNYQANRGWETGADNTFNINPEQTLDPTFREGGYPGGGYLSGQGNPNTQSLMLQGGASSGNLSGGAGVNYSPHNQSVSGNLGYQVSPQLNLNADASLDASGNFNPSVGANYQKGNFNANANYNFNEKMPTVGAGYQFEDGGYYTPARALAAGRTLQAKGTQYGSNAGNYGGKTTYETGGYYKEPEQYDGGNYTFKPKTDPNYGIKQPNFALKNPNSGALPWDTDPNSKYFNTAPGGSPEFKRTNPADGGRGAGFYNDTAPGAPGSTPPQDPDPRQPMDWQNAATQAGKLAPVAYNFWKGQQEPDYFKNNPNQEYENTRDLMQSRRYDAAPEIAGANRVWNQGRDALAQSSSGEAAYQQNLQGLSQQAARQRQQVYANKNNMDNQYIADEARTMSGLGATLSNQLNQSELYRLQTDAAKDAFTGEGFKGVGDYAQMEQLMNNKKMTDDERMRILDSQYSKYAQYNKARKKPAKKKKSKK